MGLRYKIRWQHDHMYYRILFCVLFSDGSTLNGDIPLDAVSGEMGVPHNGAVENKIQEIIYSYLNRTKDITPTRPVIEHNNNGRLISNE
jgi:hypothetical protein